jgi:hypothetical protein
MQVSNPIGNTNTMEPTTHQDSPSWLFFVHASFVIALCGMLGGITTLSAPIIVKGYLSMGLMFVVSATLTLSKTVRDNHESKKLHHRLIEVKTEKMLKEFELK